MLLHYTSLSSQIFWRYRNINRGENRLLEIRLYAKLSVLLKHKYSLQYLRKELAETLKT